MAPSLSVFYGSQTGCAESIAKRVYDEAQEKGLDATFASLNDFQNSRVMEAAATPQYVVIVCSTTGNGDPPDNCSKFWRFVKRRTQPKDLLANVSFTVLGLGDTNYDKFCYMGKSIDKRMPEVGAQRFYDMCAADEAMGLEDQVEPWLEGLWPTLLKSVGAPAGGAETVSSSDEDASKDDSVAKAESALDETEKPPLPENMLTFDAMFGPRDGPTAIPEDVPRLQSSMYSIRFADASEATVPVATTEKPADEEYSVTHPFLATVHKAKLLTKSKSERKVLYIELDTTGSDIKYAPGDSIGIKCPNRDEDVDAVLKHLGIDGDAVVFIEPTAPATGARRGAAKASTSNRFPTPCSVREILTQHVDLLSSPKKAVLRALATYCSDEEENARMLVLSSKSGADKYKQFVSDQTLNFVDILQQFPTCKPPLDHVLSLLPQLMPRFYSIATSPLVNSNNIGIAFTIVDEPVGPYAIRRRGLCTNWLHAQAHGLLTESAGAEFKVPMFLRPTRDFLQPAEQDRPVLLIGPGTGVAPFMGFLQHRQNEARKHVDLPTPAESGESKGIFLFFGCRRRDEDWIFEEDMKEYLGNGTLHQLFTAFSREQEEKYYVQHDLRANGALAAKVLLEDAGYVYVCGDGTQMAKDVNEALRDVLQEHGHLTQEQADEHLRSLAARQRYVRDIW